MRDRLRGELAMPISTYQTARHAVPVMPIGRGKQTRPVCRATRILQFNLKVNSAVNSLYIRQPDKIGETIGWAGVFAT
jgi:hypothetical protein